MVINQSSAGWMGERREYERRPGIIRNHSQNLHQYQFSIHQKMIEEVTYVTLQLFSPLSVTWEVENHLIWVRNISV